MNPANDNTFAHPDYVALASLNTGELKILAFMVDRRDQGILFEAGERRFGAGLFDDGTWRFEAPREAWDAAIDLRTILRCGTRTDAVTATGLHLYLVETFAAGLGH